MQLEDLYVGDVLYCDPCSLEFSLRLYSLFCLIFSSWHFSHKFNSLCVSLIPYLLFCCLVAKSCLTLLYLQPKPLCWALESRPSCHGPTPPACFQVPGFCTCACWTPLSTPIPLWMVLLPSAPCASSPSRVFPFTTLSVLPHVQSNTASLLGFISKMPFKSLSSTGPCLCTPRVSPSLSYRIFCLGYWIHPVAFLFLLQTPARRIFPKRKSDHTKSSA